MAEGLARAAGAISCLELKKMRIKVKAELETCQAPHTHRGPVVLVLWGGRHGWKYRERPFCSQKSPDLGIQDQNVPGI